MEINEMVSKNKKCGQKLKNGNKWNGQQKWKMWSNKYFGQKISVFRLDLKKIHCFVKFFNIKILSRVKIFNVGRSEKVQR